MKVDIWSDVVCPFCYIGKRKFEQALASFAHRDEVEVVWHSFQLDPHSQPAPGESIHAVLARKKGISTAEAREMGNYVTQAAHEVGLRYDFDRTVPANTFLAHQLIHLGAHHGRQDATKERLMAAYYLEGQPIGDLETLVQLGAEVGPGCRREPRRPCWPALTPMPCATTSTRPSKLGCAAYPSSCSRISTPYQGPSRPSCLPKFGKVYNEFKPQLPVMADGATCGPEGCD